MNRMRNWLVAFLFGVAVSASAWAADNSTLPVSGGGTEVFANKDIGSVKFPKQIPYDSGGGDMTDSTLHALKIDSVSGGRLETALGTGAATNGATYPLSSIGVGHKDSSGNIQPVIGDPCEVNVPTSTPISITTATTTRIISPAASKKTYICSLSLQAASADNVGIVEGTGGTCGTSTAGIYGGTTASSGLNLVANQGFAWGGGKSAIMATAGTNVDFCLITSAAVNLAGHVRWVQAP